MSSAEKNNQENNPKNKHDIPIDTEFLLLVEGEDDHRFFRRLCCHLELARYYPYKLNGKDKLDAVLKRLRGLLPPFDKLQSFAIILDADDSAQDTLQDVNKKLAKYYQGDFVPFGKNGDIVKFPKKRIQKVGLFIMPGLEYKQGALEDLILQYIQKEHPTLKGLSSCVEKFQACRDGTIPQSWRPDKHKQKRALQAYLSMLPEHAVYVGDALGQDIASDSGEQQSFVNFDSPIFKELRDFLRDCASVPQAHS